MRLVTFEQAGRQRLGALLAQDQAVLDLRAAHQAGVGGDPPALHSLLALIEAGEPALDHARSLVRRADAAHVIPRSAVRLLAPLHPPPQMRDFSCFALHLEQSFAAAARMGRRPPPEGGRDPGHERVMKTFARQPIYYKCNRFAVTGTDSDVQWPGYSELLDFELEFGCYIGRAAKDVPRERAHEYIVGYTIFNDFTARDTQAVEMAGMLGPAKGKDFDTSNAMGPCLVTVDELPDPYGLAMVARVNGVEWGRGNTRDMHWRFDDVIAHLSRSETLHPGEFLGSGTVGNGSGLEQLRFLQPGDVVELEIEGLGLLRNRLVRP